MMNEKHTCALEIEKRKVVLRLFFDCDLFLQNFSLSIQFVYCFEALMRQYFIPSQPLEKRISLGTADDRKYSKKKQS